MLYTKEYTKSHYYKAMSITELFLLIIVAKSASFLKSVMLVVDISSINLYILEIFGNTL